MSSYFRCGNSDGDCPLARTNEAVATKDWVCPISHANCEVLREPVSAFEVHKSKIFGGGIGILVILLLLFGSALLKPDPFSSKLTEISNTASALQGRLSSIESKGEATSAMGDPMQTLKRIEVRAGAGLEKVREALAQDLPEVAKREVEAIEALVEQAKTAQQSSRNPSAAVGSKAVEAQELLIQYQDLESLAEELQFDAELDQRTDVAAECETILQNSRQGLSRLAAIINPPKREVDEVALKQALDSIIEVLNQAKSTLAAYKPVPKAPFHADEAELMISTSPDLSSGLVVPLLAAFLSTSAISPGDGIHYFSENQKTGKTVVIESASPSYGQLVSGDCDLLISSLEPTQEEEAAYQNAFPGESLRSRSQTEVVALDALTFVAHPDSDREEIEGSQVSALSWVTGPLGSPSELAAKRFGITSTTRSNASPANSVLSDRSLVGAGVFHEEGPNIRAKRLAFRAAADARAVKPSPFSIATEDYRYAFRILASHSPNSSESAKNFVQFITSEEGQEVVASQGFVDLRLRPAGGDVDPLILATIGETLGIDDVQRAIRISTNFRFAIGESRLDIKALADLERLPRYIADDYPEGRVVILGFTDSTGGPSINGPLSQDRAEEIAGELRKTGMDISAAGLGDRLPLDSNSTEEGKARNRRAEVWVVP